MSTLIRPPAGLVTIEQRIIDVIVSAVAEATSFRHVFDAEVPTDWVSYPRPSLWVEQQELDTGEPGGFFEHYASAFNLELWGAFDFNEKDQRRGLERLGRSYLGEIQWVLPRLDKTLTHNGFAIREMPGAMFARTIEAGVGGIRSPWRIEYTRPRIDPYYRHPDN